MTSASCRVTVDMPRNKQYSSPISRQSYQVHIQVIVINMLPFWSVLNTNVITARSLERHVCQPVIIKTKINTGVSIQTNKIDLVASCAAWLQNRTAIHAIASITVTAATIALWLKSIMKHLSNRVPYLSSRKALPNPAAPSTSEMTRQYSSSFFLWLGLILSFCAAFFRHSSFSSLWRGQWLGIFWLRCFVCSPPCLHFEFELESIWPG